MLPSSSFYFYLYIIILKSEKNYMNRGEEIDRHNSKSEQDL